jgi:hypothetical protein
MLVAKLVGVSHTIYILQQNIQEVKCLAEFPGAAVRGAGLLVNYHQS